MELPICPDVVCSCMVVVETCQVFIITEATIGKRKICMIKTGIIIMYSMVIWANFHPP
jgi:hypothetical protein